MTADPVIRTARPGDEPALFALWAECFGDAPHLPALWALDPDRHRHTFLAARDTIDAAVVYVPRALRDARGVVQRVGGIGSVATRPEARGRGLVRALLTAAVATMTAEGCAWSLLFTGTPGVYRGSGWEEFPRPWTGGELVSSPRGPGRYRVRDATPGDVPRLAALHSAYNTVRPLTSVRSAEDWRVRIPAWYGGSGGPDTWSLVAETGAGEVVGWLVARAAGAGGVQILEVAVSERGVGDLATFPERESPCPSDDLYAALAGRARAAGRATARILLPASAEATRAARTLLTPGTVTHGTDTSGMARPLLAPAADVRATVTAPGAAHWYGDSF
ncbi:GNAT family N-acetyltransferase [Streptomyces sp. NPDC091292]|uniref:GNAT family N-acetyltransferase n=1 Tax=Streptomyces sp. NPDC091292 TaxID=3365991 RepID=UPI00381FDE36